MVPILRFSVSSSLCLEAVGSKLHSLVGSLVQEVQEFLGV